MDKKKQEQTNQSCTTTFDKLAFDSDKFICKKSVLKHKTEPSLLRNIEPFNLQREGFLPFICTL